MTTIHDRSLTDGLILLSAIIGFVWLALVVIFVWIYFDRYLPCCRRIQTRYGRSGSETVNGPERNAARFEELSNDDRRKILKVVFPSMPYGRNMHHDTMGDAALTEDVENQRSNATQLCTDEMQKGNDVIGDIGNQCSNVTNPAINTAQEANTGADGVEHDRTCAICLQNYVEGEDVVVGRGCSHIFHTDCVMAWLEEHNLCPCCRNEMMTNEDMRLATLQLSS